MKNENTLLNDRIKALEEENEELRAKLAGYYELQEKYERLKKITNLSGLLSPLQSQEEIDALNNELKIIQKENNFFDKINDLYDKKKRRKIKTQKQKKIKPISTKQKVTHTKGDENEEQNVENENDTLYSTQAINDSLTTWQKLITLLSAITIIVYLLFLLIKGMSMEKYFRQKNREEALKKIPDDKGGGKGGTSGISNNSTTNKSDYNNNMYNNIYLR